jgi:type VI secretion system secreted protein Hcp
MAVDMFIKIDGIPGESQDKTYRDAIEVLAWNWGAKGGDSSIRPGTGAAAAKTTLQGFSFTKQVDRATPKIYESLMQGKHIKECIFSCRKPGEKDKYLEIKMLDCLLSSVSTGCEIGEGRPMENVILLFNKVQLDYYYKDANGVKTVTFKWDLIASGGKF